MASDLELLLFEEQFRDLGQLPEASRWWLERDSAVPLGLYAVMHPISHPTERYKARLRWTDLFAAPSLKFIHLETGADNDPTAWPQCFGFRPASLDACVPWTAEGQALHPEWKNSPAHAYPKVDAPLQYGLLRVQHALDSSYQGRGRR